MLRSVRTELLEISFHEDGPKEGVPVLLLHGWPDAPIGWFEIARQLNAQGWRTIVPFLRGSQPTRFLSEATPRFGGGVALAQDAIELADSLGIDRFSVVGHDWGARAAYSIGALYPERITSIAGLALAYQPRATFTIPEFAQSRRFWYQWFLCTDGGAQAVREDPTGFARIQWETWSPAGWFSEEEFRAAAESFKSSDWAAITLSAYRTRWIKGEPFDPKYLELQRRLGEVERLSIPTLMIQGGADMCDDAKESEDLEAYFDSDYQRALLKGIGHFPHREAPREVAELLLGFLAQNQ